MKTNKHQALDLSLVAAAIVAALGMAPVAQAQPAPPTSPTPVVDYEYDANGNLTKTTQAKGVPGFGFESKGSYDALNRQKNVTDAKNGVTEIGYDGLDRTVSIKDPRSLLTQYPRSGLGDLKQLISPDTGTASNTYDATGNLKTRIDSRGVLSTYTYDALNRVKSLVYSKSGSTSQTYTWTYDQTGAGYSNGIGRLTSTAHPTGSTQYTYDPQGRVLTDIQRVKLATGANPSQVSKTVTYAYDNAGHVSSIVYPSGRKLSLTYSGGQLSALALAKNTTAAATPLISQIQFDPFGGPRSWLWQLASGTQLHERIVDSAGRVVRYRLGANLRDVSYDAANRVTAYTHYSAAGGAPQPSPDQSFGYDELGRLTTVTTATASWSLSYDANGNRTGLTLNGSPSTYTVAATSNRLTATTNPARSFGYDNAGNTTADTYTSTYDLAGRMAALVKGGVATTYSIDGLGRRIRKFSSTGAASTVIFVYDQGGQLLGEYDSTGKAICEYVWLGNTPIAVFTPDPANASNPPLVYYVHSDHLSTPRVVLDKSNNLRWTWIAEPFGTTAANNNPQSLGAFTLNLRSPGQYFDQESGLHYNFFRDYDPSIGRFVQSDPIGLNGGINTYASFENNPLSNVDAFGLYTEIIRWATDGSGDGAFGHISGNINGRNFSWGQGGWDSKFPSAQDYIRRQVDEVLRNGQGVILALTPAQESKLASCLLAKKDETYNAVTNNCGSPWLSCLQELGVVNAEDKARVIPLDVIKIIADSPKAIGQTSYTAPGNKSFDLWPISILKDAAERKLQRGTRPNGANTLQP